MPVGVQFQLGMAAATQLNGRAGLLALLATYAGSLPTNVGNRHAIPIGSNLTNRLTRIAGPPLSIAQSNTS